MFATGPCRRWMVRFWPTRTQSLTREERNCSCRTPKALRHVSDSEASLGKCRGLRKSLWLEPGPDEVCIGHSTLEPSVLLLQFFEAGASVASCALTAATSGNRWQRKPPELGRRQRGAGLRNAMLRRFGVGDLSGRSRRTGPWRRSRRSAAGRGCATRRRSGRCSEAGFRLRDRRNAFTNPLASRAVAYGVVFSPGQRFHSTEPP